MSRAEVVLEARTGEAPGTAIPEAGSRPGSVRVQVRNLFSAAGEEVFHDGVTSRFSDGLVSLVRTKGQPVVDPVARLMAEFPRFVLGFPSR